MGNARSCHSVENCLAQLRLGGSCSEWAAAMEGNRSRECVANGDCGSRQRDQGAFLRATVAEDGLRPQRPPLSCGEYYP